ncbi:YafY family protein [Pedobacter sp. L105]|uniref:helix-turn-helix transcriptional regulator n=1 Tax=Pedobacter sp. L105 TaxID=1641871 RepID=UPI00131DE823|nr:YafY family protein [Pedobacter sp. L105]
MLNRIDRLSAIIIQLQSRKILKAQDIADRFEISLRTVYRDIRSLEKAGVPLIGEAGVGYSLVEGYRLPPVVFNREEATALVTAEKLVLSLTDPANGNAYSLALDKIRAVLKIADKDYLEHIDHRIEVVKNKRPPELLSQANPLQLILGAIASKQVMLLNYFSYYRQEHTCRLIEPIGVFYLDHYWHLIAWCRERESYRDFRFDRINSVFATEELFEDQHPSLKSYLHDQYQKYEFKEITLRVDKEAYLHLGEQKYYEGYVSENYTPDGVEMYFLTISIEGFARWFMTFADYATIIHSEELKARVKSLFRDISKKMKDL